MSASSIIVRAGLVVVGLVALVSTSEAQVRVRPIARPQPALAKKTLPALPGPGHQAVGGFAQASPDLVITQQSITGPATLVGIKYKVPVMLKVRNQGAAKAGFFNSGVRYAQPAGVANPSLNQYTGFAIFLTAADGNVGVMQLNPGQEITLIGFAYLPQNLGGKTVYLRGWADTDSLEFPTGHGSVSEMNESNNWSGQMSVVLP